MDAKHASEMFKHLEKQSEFLMDAHQSMSHQLLQLQVEEEMLMRKFHEIMSARRRDVKTTDHSKAGHSTALGCVEDK